MPTTVFNADDHPILRKGITDLIREAPGLEWVGSAANGLVALEKIDALAPDIAILDVQMPHLTGLEVAQKLLNRGTETRFILLTLFKEPHLLKDALAAGIQGFILKESSEQEILNCVHSVAKGRSYVNASLTHFLINQSDDSSSPLEHLSRQEKSILKLIAKEKTSNEIAEMLFVSPKTVANHRSNITRKLNLGGAQNSLLKWAMANRDLLG